jgi:hypothetical protein
MPTILAVIIAVDALNAEEYLGDHAPQFATTSTYAAWHF